MNIFDLEHGHYAIIQGRTYRLVKKGEIDGVFTVEVSDIISRERRSFTENVDCVIETDQFRLYAKGAKVAK